MKQIKIIPFDINLISSENVFTRDGRSARILCTDRKNNQNLPILALIPDDAGDELGLPYDINGKYNGYESEGNLDLVIHKEIMINLHFEPFQKILVRHGKHNIWIPAFYSHELSQYNENNELVELHHTIGDRRGYNSNCVLPYDDFKHLCNTSDDPIF